MVGDNNIILLWCTPPLFHQQLSNNWSITGHISNFFFISRASNIGYFKTKIKWKLWTTTTNRIGLEPTILPLHLPPSTPTSMTSSCLYEQHTSGSFHSVNVLPTYKAMSCFNPIASFPCEPMVKKGWLIIFVSMVIEHLSNKGIKVCTY